MVDMSLRILHVSQPTDAGVAVCVAQDIADQTARGWHVVLACPPDSWLSRGALGEGVDVRPWKASRSPGPGMLGETIRLRRVLRATRPHLLHLHSSKAMLAGRLAARGRVETVVQPHAWSFEAVAPPWNIWATAWERAAARWTSAILCVSEAERQRGEGAGIVGRYVTTPNGVDLVAFPLPGPDDRAAARRRLGSPAAADAPLAVCVGRLSAQKGQDVLVECWPRVRSTLPEAQLVLVGDGPARFDLAQRASTGVHLVGASGDVPGTFPPMRRRCHPKLVHLFPAMTCQPSLRPLLPVLRMWREQTLKAASDAPTSKRIMMSVRPRLQSQLSIVRFSPAGQPGLRLVPPWRDL